MSQSTETVETIDIDTFKSWLQGVEDMQEDDWHPNPVQWKKIRNKINLLTAAAVEPPRAAPYQMPNFANPGAGTWGGMAPVQGPVTVPLAHQPRPLMPAPPPSSLDATPKDNQVDENGNFTSSFA